MKNNRLIPIFLYLFINFLFAFKYINRVSNFALLSALIYSTIIVLIIILFNYLPNEYFTNLLFYIFTILFSICILIIFQQIKVESLNVDRWSMIQSFWDRLLNWEFPYIPTSFFTNTPGPFPFYFLIAFPFYLLGEIGYLSLLGYILLIIFIRINFSDNKTVFLLSLMSSISPAFLWELTVRSTLVINMVIILFYLYWVEQKYINNSWAHILTGLCAGLLISTRGIVVIPLLIYFSYKMIKNHEWRNTFIIGSAAILGFFITILPLLIWDFEGFIKYNPITLQANFIDTSILICLIIVSMVSGLFIKNFNYFCLVTGIVVFSAILIPFINAIQITGWKNVVLYNGFDISYFLLSFPFLIISIPKISENFINT